MDQHPQGELIRSAILIPGTQYPERKPRWSVLLIASHDIRRHIRLAIPDLHGRRRLLGGPTFSAPPPLSPCDDLRGYIVCERIFSKEWSGHWKRQGGP